MCNKVNQRENIMTKNTPYTVNSTSGPRKRKKPIKTTIEAKLVAFMDSYKTPTVLGPPYQDDEDLSFFKSLIPTVKTLRQDQKMNFIINVMEMLKDLTTPSLL